MSRYSSTCRASGQSTDAVRSDRNTDTWLPITRSATKKSSPTAARPIVPPSEGCCFRARIRLSRFSAKEAGRTSASQVSSSR
jgi:hypothetical protein